MISSSSAILAEGLGDNVPLMIVIVVGVSVLAMVLTRRRIAARSDGRSARRSAALRPGTDQGAGRRELQKSMEQLLLELEELSREINGQVDTRLRALNLLIQEADGKIKELRRLQGHTDDEGQPADRLPPPKQEPHPDLTSQRYARVYALAEKGRSVIEIAREMGLMTGEVELILALRRTVPRSAEGEA